MPSAELHRTNPLRGRGVHQPHEPLDQVFDPAERADLLAAAVDAYVAVAQRRHDALHHQPLIHQVGSAAIGVVDACDTCVYVELLAVGAVQGFGCPFPLHEGVCAPASFGSGGTGVAHLARRGKEHAGMLVAGRVERVDRPGHADLQRFDRKRLVVAYA